MDFTREPIIETIITPKEGYKLVVRSSKSTGQEEYFVDAVEVVAFGNAFFFRSMEKPKAFLVPISDYEVLEVREARMVLKTAGPDRSIKIGGGRETSLKVPKETKEPIEEGIAATEQEPATTEALEEKPEAKLDKKRDRRRQSRKRRGKDETQLETKEEPAIPALEEDKISIPEPKEGVELSTEESAPITSSVLSSLLQPPPKLISETIGRYKENAMFKSAFFMTEDEQYKAHTKVEDLLNEDDETDFKQSLQEPTFKPEQPEQPELLFEQEEKDHSQPLEEDSGVPMSVEDADLFLSEEGLGLPSQVEHDDDLNPKNA